jgi:hypothetical protein
MTSQTTVATLTRGQSAFKTESEANAAAEALVKDMITKQLPTPASTQLTIKTEIKEAFRDPEFQGDLVSLMKTALCEEFGIKVTALEGRVTALVGHVQTLEASHTVMAERIQTLEAKQPALANQVQTLEARQTSTQQRTIMAQSGKANNVLINGIAETTDESPEALVKNMATAINVKLGAFTAKRIGKVADNKTRSILVCCNTYWDKRKLYAARTTLQDNNYADVYINEDLPSKQAELFFRARQARKQKLIKSAWTENGLITIRIAEGGQALTIGSIEKLTELVPEYTIPQ